VANFAPDRGQHKSRGQLAAAMPSRGTCLFKPLAASTAPRGSAACSQLLGKLC
jgi:hypothetical protein